MVHLPDRACNEGMMSACKRMSKTARGLEPSVTHELTPRRANFPRCGKPMRADYTNYRTITTLAGVARLNLTIRRCRNPDCTSHKKPYRPEAEGRFALPHHEFGFDVVALVGRFRYAEHRSVPEIRRHFIGRGLVISERSVTNRLDRYDELLAIAVTDDRRLKKVWRLGGK